MKEIKEIYLHLKMLQMRLNLKIMVKNNINYEKIVSKMKYEAM